MLSWAITFLIVALIAAVFGFGGIALQMRPREFHVAALIAAVFGFGGIAGTAVGIAKLLFFVFIVLFVVSLIFHRRTPTA